MFDDARIAAAFESLLGAMSPPSAPLARIRERLATPQPAKRSRRWELAVVAAAAAAIVLSLPRVSPALTDALEAQIQQILHWKPPPPAPQRVWSAMRPQSVSLAQAKARANFRIVQPAGLPNDVVSETISATAPGLYSQTTHSWSVGTPVVMFTYRRSGGRTFMLTATRYDARESPPAKYIFEDMDRKQNGREAIARRDVFTWRNGDQTTSVVADEGITAAEAVAIRTAMGGVPIPGVWPRPESRGPIEQYRLP
jgi:hypothetical protein